MKATVIAKIAGEAWGKLTEKQKAKYAELAKKDVIRFEKETKQVETQGYFVDKNGKKSFDQNIMELKFKPHVVTPQKVKSAYAFFVKEKFAEVKAANNCKMVTDTAPFLSAMWAKMTDAQKKPFFDQSELDQKRYEKEVKDLLKQGFFMTKKGEKSSDVKKKLPKKRT